MSKSEKDRELADREKLLRAWRHWHQEQLEQALDGMSGDIMRGLMAQLKDLRSARELINFTSARDWSRVDADTRLVALHEINTAITRLRERAGLDPISDPLWGEPPSAFQMIRKIMSSAKAEVTAAGRSTGKSME